MSRTFHHGKKGGRRDDSRIRVRGIRRETPDLRRLARALIELAQAEAEAAAQADHEAKGPQRPARERPSKEGGNFSEGESTSGDAA